MHHFTSAEAHVADDVRIGPPTVGLLRFLTCGSVDDGKSTLIGRLLFDCRLLYEDQLEALTADTARFGTTAAGELDFALLVDGLEAEREQGITIDVAYRYFSTARRRFVVADAPGHEQYTRNMATAASTAELAVLLVDARKGLLTQTFRHSYIASLMGIRHVVLAVNKMDAVGWDQKIFDEIAAAYRKMAAEISLATSPAFRFRRCAATTSPGPAHPCPGTLVRPWSHLDRSMSSGIAGQSRFAWRCSGSIGPIRISAAIAVPLPAARCGCGDRVVVLPSGQTTRIARIVTMDDDLESAAAGEAVTLTVGDELDIGRGDVIAAEFALPGLAEQFAAHLIWMSDQADAARALVFSGSPAPPPCTRR